MTGRVRQPTRRRIATSAAKARSKAVRDGGVFAQPAVVREPPRSENGRSFAWDHLKLVHTIVHDEALQICLSASGEPVTATELSQRCKMRIARCYPWLHKLESLGLIASQEGPPGRNGIRSRLYTSTLRSLSVRLEDGGIRTRVEVNGGATPLVTECMTMMESSEPVAVPDVRSLRRTGGAIVVHFVDPPKTKRSRPRRFPISLPAFLQAPLPRDPERR